MPAPINLNRSGSEDVNADELTDPPTLSAASPSSSSASPSGNQGIITDIISSVFDGGVNRGLILGLHASFAGLVLVLLALYVLSGWNGHVLALTGVSLGLWGSTGWFVMELMKAQKVQLEEDAAKAAAAGKGETVDGEQEKEGKKDR